VGLGEGVGKGVGPGVGVGVGVGAGLGVGRVGIETFRTPDDGAFGDGDALGEVGSSSVMV